MCACEQQRIEVLLFDKETRYLVKAKISLCGISVRAYACTRQWQYNVCLCAVHAHTNIRAHVHTHTHAHTRAQTLNHANTHTQIHTSTQVQKLEAEKQKTKEQREREMKHSSVLVSSYTRLYAHWLMWKISSWRADSSAPEV